MSAINKLINSSDISNNELGITLFFNQKELQIDEIIIFDNSKYKKITFKNYNHFIVNCYDENFVRFATKGRVWYVSKINSHLTDIRNKNLYNIIKKYLDDN